MEGWKIISTIFIYIFLVVVHLFPPWLCRKCVGFTLKNIITFTCDRTHTEMELSKKSKHQRLNLEDSEVCERFHFVFYFFHSRNNTGTFLLFMSTLFTRKCTILFRQVQNGAQRRTNQRTFGRSASDISVKRLKWHFVHCVSVTFRSCLNGNYDETKSWTFPKDFALFLYLAPRNGAAKAFF